MSACADPPCTLGVLAFGDSITNGGGELQWGVALQSWALWAARGLGLPYTGFAVDGAQVGDVIGSQIPLFVASSTAGGGRYQVGCLYIGVNDVRGLGWEPGTFERDFRVAVDFLLGRCERVLVATAPLDLGRPPAGAKVEELNGVVRRVAADTGALVLDLSDFGARNHVMTDHVHPTAFGQIAIAERALAVLAADGMALALAPTSLIRYETTRWRRLRGDLTYTYRHAKVSVRSAVIRAQVALGLWRA